MSHAIRVFGHQIVRLVLLGLLVVVLFWQWLTLLGQPDYFFPSRIDLTLAPGETRVFGREELAAAAADTGHLRVRRAADGAWWVGNASATHAVELNRGGHEELLRSLPLATGMTISVRGQVLRIMEATDEHLTLGMPAGGQVIYDGSGLSGGARPACPERPLTERLMQPWNRWAPGFLRRSSDLELGGLLDCDNRVALPGVARGTARIFQDEAGRFLIQAGWASDAVHAVCGQVAAGGCAPGGSLSEQEMPLAGVDSLIVGRTHFAVSPNADKLTLLPSKRVARYFSSNHPVPPGVVWQMEKEDHWHWPLRLSPALMASLALLLVALMAAWTQWRDPTRPTQLAIARAASGVLAIAGGLAYWQGSALGAGWSLALISGVSVLTLFSPVRGLALFSLGLATLLGSVGLAALLALGLSGADSDGLRFFQSNAGILAIGLALLFGQAFRGQSGARRDSALLERALFTLAFAALGGLLVQFGFGGEAGVFGFQPVELAKLALVLLAAHVLALRMDWRQTRSRIAGLALWLRFLLPVLLFLALMATALLMVHDISPLVLMGAWGFASLIAWVFASGRLLATLALATLVIGMGAGALWGLTQGDDAIVQVLPYADRIAVWLAPELHPHSGEQLARAGRLIQQGGETGLATAQAWQVPAIQDDFAPAWFLARFGAVGGAVLVLLQTLYLATLLALGWRSLNTETGDFQAVWLGRLRYFALWGGAGLLLGHFIISWGTNLGWLPVMGQPAPYLSYGGSLLAFFLIPLQALALEPVGREGVPVSPSPRKKRS